MSLIKSVAGASSVIVSEEYTASKNQILIGKSTIREALKALQNVGANEYVITKIDKKLVIAGNTDETIGGDNKISKTLYKPNTTK